MELKLERELSTNKSTPGVLYVDGVRESYTLEDVVREKRYEDGTLIAVNVWKIPKLTAIPSGRYPVILDYSQRFSKLMPHLLNVPGFSGIRIHSGNAAGDTEGCILVGKVRTSGDEILQSRLAFESLFATLQAAVNRDERIWIQINNPPDLAQRDLKLT